MTFDGHQVTSHRITHDGHEGILKFKAHPEHFSGLLKSINKKDIIKQY